MPYRPKDIYRGRRKYRVPLAIALFLLAFLLIGAVVLFYVLQQFLVYDQTGVSLVLPFMEGYGTEEVAATPEPTFEPVEVTVVYEDPDFSQVDLGGWQELSPTRARFVAFSDAADEMRLNTVLANLSDSYTGVVLELKGRSGQLAWASQSATAVGYGTAGTMDYTEIIESLHERGLTAAAQISCLADELMATRNWLIALQTLEGQPYQDDSGVWWLDPYNRTVRDYIEELMGELAEMGFDEIILADLYHPVLDSYWTDDSQEDTEAGEDGSAAETQASSGTGFRYTVTIQTAPNPVNAICQMGRRLAENLGETGAAVSALVDYSSLVNGRGERTGQDIGIFWRLFARLYCRCESWDAAGVLEEASASLNAGSASVRFAPVCDYESPEGFDSYVIRVPE